MYQEFSKGTIEIITGPMFSGKSQELIKRIKILGHANVKTLIIKPDIDKRWDKGKILSRAGSSIKTLSASKVSQIKKHFDQGHYEALAIDEVQFFEDKILDFVIEKANQGIRVIVSGLDQDFQGKPFGIMPQLLAVADIVDKQHAVCQVCGKAATMSFKIGKSDKIIQIGDKEYQPRCRKCHLAGELKKQVITG